MGTTAAKTDRSILELKVEEIVRQLLTELESARALEELARKHASAHLERDLALGSLERVELILRLRAAFAAELPDATVAQADTVADLVDAVSQQTPTGHATSAQHRASTSFSTPAPLAARADLQERLVAAQTLTEAIRIRGREEPETPHIHLLDESGQAHTITCGELLERATRVCAALRREGISPGDTIAIMLPTSAEFFWAFAGVMLAGAIPVPIYPPFRADRIEEYAARQAAILRNAEARLLITFDRAQAVARLLAPQVKSLRGVFDAASLSSAPTAEIPEDSGILPAETYQHRAKPQDIAFLQYTSGSTGNPKGVVLTHANLLANIRSIAAGLGLRHDDVAVSWLPLYHDMGLIGAWFVPLLTRIPLALLSPLAFLSKPSRWLRAIHDYRGTISPAPNFAYELCLRKISHEEMEGLDLSCWRAALNGAEPVRVETLEAFAKKFSRCGFRKEALLPVYGLAEACLGVACPRPGSGWRVDRIGRTRFEAEGRAVPATEHNWKQNAEQDSEGNAKKNNVLEFASAGAPLPQMEIRVVDANDRDADERVQGRLLFRGPSATSGYYRNPEATRELVRPADAASPEKGGWLDTGDLAYIAEGQLYLTGRAKDIIIKGGRNIHPQEIEDVARQVPGVRAGCVVAFGVPDAASGTEKLIVVAETRDQSRIAQGQRQKIESEISRRVSEALGILPDAVYALPLHAIPKTSSGKLRRSETRRLFLEGKLLEPVAPPWLQMVRLTLKNAPLRLWLAAKNAALRIAEVIYGLYALVLFGVAAAIVALILLPMRNRRASATIVRDASRILLRLAAIRLQVHNKFSSSSSQESPWIFAPNHTSYLDILILLAALPAGVRYVAKDEIYAMPLVGLMARRCGHLAFRRSDPQARVAEAKEIEGALRRGDSLVIYPEGTFTPEPGVRPFQLGAFKAAVDTGRPICPVAVRGARELLRDKTLLPRPGRTVVTFGPLIFPQAGADAWKEIIRLRDETREIIARGSGEPML